MRPKFLRWLRNAPKILQARKIGNVVEIDPEDIPRVHLKIRHGGNRIRIGKLRPGRGLVKIDVYATDSDIEIADGLLVNEELRILVGQNLGHYGLIRNVSVRIGRSATFVSTALTVLNSNARVSIGDDCLFADGTAIFHTDAHPVYDFDTGGLANPVGTLAVGRHVWIGAQATLLKNSCVPDGCIVGWGSVVARRFSETNVAIAGNPAHVVSKDGRRLRWEHGDPAYIENESGGKHQT